jgi:hypothetical protein
MKTFTTVIPTVFNRLKQSSTFLSVMGYTNEYNEVSNFGIVFHVDYIKAVKKAINIWLSIKPKNDLEKRALLELITAYKDTLNGKSHSTSAHSYDRIVDGDGKLIKGVKWHEKGNSIHLWGFLVHKVILQPALYPNDNRSSLTLEKTRLLQLTPIGRFRQYKLLPNRFNSIGVESLTLSQQDLIKMI